VASRNKSGKKYEGLRRLAKDNKVVHKHLDTIAAHHKQVMALCDKLDAHCAKGHGDAEAVGDCCHEIAHTLKSAQAEHEKLMQHFGRPEPKKPSFRRRSRGRKRNRRQPRIAAFSRAGRIVLQERHQASAP
jgi:hypothetical protein